MARARNIKPSTFTNDDLADNEPLGRLLFIGMWTIADCNGNIEWKPRRIKAQLLPYDDCDIEKLAINLDHSGFIRFYSDQGFNYVNVVNFTVHQNPHKNERERGTTIPKFSEIARQAIDLKGLTINLDLSGSELTQDGTDPADSLILNPDSLVLIPDTPEKPTPPSAPEWVNQYLELFWSEYPKKVDKKKTLERLTKMIKQKPDQQHFGMILEKVRAKALVDDKQFWPSPDRYLREEKWNDEIITQGVTHGQHQQATQPKLSALDRVKANAAERERKRSSAQGGEFDGQSLGEAIGDVRPQIHEPVRGDTGRYMGNLLEGDFSQTDS